jgi:hypothetical protein
MDSDTCVDDADIVEIKTSYVQEHWTPNGVAKETVDCIEEWNRYLERIGYKDEV